MNDRASYHAGKNAHANIVRIHSDDCLSADGQFSSRSTAPRYPECPVIVQRLQKVLPPIFFHEENTDKMMSTFHPRSCQDYQHTDTHTTIPLLAHTHG